MFSKEEVKKNLLGCLEIFLFMPKGIDRFDSSKAAAIRSFIIPALVLPLVMVIFVYQSTGYAWEVLVSLHFVRILLSVILSFAAVYFFSKQFDRQEHFYKFITVSNWSNVPGVLMTLPIIIGLFSGHDMAVFESYAVFLSLISVLYCGFVLTHCFRVPWEMGGFIAIVMLAIDQNLFDLTIYIRDTVAI